MSDVTLQRLARRLRELRTDQGLTLQDVARLTGLSKGLLSKVETGAVSPPVATLAKLAEAFGVSIGEFFASPNGGESVVFFPKSKRKRGRRGRSPGQNSHKSELLVTGRRRDMRPVLVSVEGKNHKFKLTDHAGEQFIYLLQGELNYVVGEKVYLMKPGDALYFAARVMHGPKPNKEQKALFLVVSSAC